MSTPEEDSSTSLDFFSNILTPGSSLNPTFLVIVDAAFVLLFLVFTTLAIITSGNIHILFLLVIELCLWASIKWFVSELKNLPIEPQDESSAHVGENSVRKNEKLQEEKKKED